MNSGCGHRTFQRIEGCHMYRRTLFPGGSFVACSGTVGAGKCRYIPQVFFRPNYGFP
jgi:hypothetical protein